MVEPTGPALAESSSDDGGSASQSDVTSERLLRNTVVNGLANVSSAVVTAVLTPFLLHRLGAAEYGVWVLALSLTFSSGYLALADLGLSEATVKFIAEARAAGQSSVINEIASTTCAVFVGIGVVLGGIIAATAPLAIALFDVSEDLAGPARATFLLMGLEVVLELPTSALRAVIEGTQRYLPLRSIDVISRLLWGALAVVAVQRGHGVVALASLTLAVAAVRLLASTVVAHRVQPGLRLRRGHVTRATVRRTFRYGGFVGGLKLLTVLYSQMDRVIVGVAISVAAVARYEVAFRIQSLTTLAMAMASSSVVPAAAYNAVRAEGNKQREMYIRGSKYGVALALPVTIAALLYTKPLVVAWVGPQYESVAHVARLLLIFPLVGCVNQVGVAMLIGLGDARRVLRLQIVAVGLNLVLSVSLVRWLGLSGVVVGTLVGGLAVWGSYLRLSLTTFDITNGEWWRRVIRPNIPGAAAQLLLGAATFRWADGFDRVGQVGLICTVSCLAHLAGFVLAGLSAGERRHLGTRLARAR